MYDFDQVQNRVGTGSVKWDKQGSFGVESGLLPFWIADTDFASLPEILEAVKKRCDHPVIGYSDYDDRCLKAIQGWYSRRHNLSVPLAYLLPAGGVVTSLWFSIQALTEPGDKILLFSPVYDPFYAIIKNTGRVLADSQMKYENHRYTIDWENVESHLKEGVKAVIFCNPHNPVGRVWSRAELQQLADLCKKYDVYLLSDEIHGDITLYGNRYTSMGLFPEIHNKLIVYTAISKTFNMAGLISSCMIIPNKELKDTIEGALAAAWIFGPTALAFPAIEAAYTYGDEWVDEQNRYLAGNADAVMEFINSEMTEVRYVKPEGTFLMWLDFRCLGMTSGEITRVLVEKYGLALGDGTHYGEQAEGFMRFNIGTSRNTLNAGLKKLKEFYNDYRR